MKEANTPTKEQLAKFWEWCGWTYKLGKHIENGASELSVWIHPSGNDGTIYLCPPALNLNNLFKYAVPKLDNIKLVKNVAPSGDVFWNGTAEYIPYVKVVTHEDPALALFCAIWGVIQ